MTTDPVHSRVDLACEQLDIAITLFFENRSDVAALTLAGAADEILGIELKNRGKTNSLAAKYSMIEKLFQRAGRKVPDWKAFKDEENYARNAAKHIADKASKAHEYDPFLRGDLRRAATHMLLRASNNLRVLELPRSDQVQRLEGWYLSEVAYPAEPEA